MKGPGQLCAGDERARAALCQRGRGQGSHVSEMKVFYHNFLPQHYISYISQKSKKSKKCNAMSCSCGKEMTLHEMKGPGLRAALCVRDRGQGCSMHKRKGPVQLRAQEEGARAALYAR